ncbi:hypothetical protein HEP87_64510 [Streptomyces sp. S1D4-11]|nr:hypothetical protein [Streptomyces sp. S1D4-11]
MSPGYIHTEMHDELITDDAGRDATAAAVPAGYNGSGDDIAHAVGFLLSPCPPTSPARTSSSTAAWSWQRPAEICLFR